MTEQESFLIETLKLCKSKNAMAMLVQTFISSNGFLSKEAGEIVRKIL